MVTDGCAFQTNNLTLLYITLNSFLLLFCQFYIEEMFYVNLGCRYINLGILCYCFSSPLLYLCLGMRGGQRGGMHQNKILSIIVFTKQKKAQQKNTSFSIDIVKL